MEDYISKAREMFMHDVEDRMDIVIPEEMDDYIEEDYIEEEPDPDILEDEAFAKEWLKDKIRDLGISYRVIKECIKDINNRYPSLIGSEIYQNLYSRLDKVELDLLGYMGDLEEVFG